MDAVPNSFSERPLNTKEFLSKFHQLMKNKDTIGEMSLIHGFLFLNKNKVDQSTWKKCFEEYREWSDKRVMELRSRFTRS
jgi:hypothetical protein